MCSPSLHCLGSTVLPCAPVCSRLHSHLHQGQAGLMLRAPLVSALGLLFQGVLNFLNFFLLPDVRALVCDVQVSPCSVTISALLPYDQLQREADRGAELLVLAQSRHRARAAVWDGVRQPSPCSKGAAAFIPPSAGDPGAAGGPGGVWESRLAKCLGGF